jgi:hypothetical protein
VNLKVIHRGGHSRRAGSGRDESVDGSSVRSGSNRPKPTRSSIELTYPEADESLKPFGIL